MADGFRVDPDQVTAHAGTVRGFADRASTAADAGSQLASLNDAYGILCQPFGMMLQLPQNRGTEALSKTEEATSGLAEALKSAAEEYHRKEDTVSETLNELTKAVDEAATSSKGTGN